MNIKKVLVIRFSSIGDIVLTTPVVRNLKANLDDAEIHFCTKEKFAELINYNPYIDKKFFYKNDLSDLISQLKAEKYNLIIDLHNNLRTALISFRLGVPTHRFNKLNTEKWLMVNLKINKLPNVHLVDRYLDTIKPLGINPDALGLDYFIPEKDEVDETWLPENFRKEYVVYAIGGQHNTKKLPFDRMVEICDRINKPIILVGGKEDVEMGDRLARFFERGSNGEEFEEGLKELNKKSLIFNACGKFNINQSASIIRKAKYVFTHDTGMMHIAAAFKRNVFSIWGNTIPSFGMYPYKTKFTILETNNLNCRPCSKIGFQKCPKGHFKCMKDIVFDFYIP